MKKLLIAAAILLFAAAASAQTPDAYYRYSVSDTITNTEADTIDLPANMLSPWSFNWTLQTTQLSGTQALAVVLQESASINGTDWIQVATVSLSGASDLDRMVGALIYGQRQRIIITGSGTQSTKYTVYFVGKKVFK